MRQELKNVLDDPTSPILDVVDKEYVENLLENECIFAKPMYGQLMTTPQVYAYLLQVNHWLKENNVNIE